MRHAMHHDAGDCMAHVDGILGWLSKLDHKLLCPQWHGGDDELNQL